MTGLEKLANAIEAFNPDEVIEKIVRGGARELEDLQREQLAAGKDANNQPYTFKGKFLYSAPTILYKKKHGKGLGAITDHFTLYQTGALYEKLKLQVKGDLFTYSSAVPYFAEVMKSVGENMLGLTQESREKFYKEVLLPKFKRAFEKETGIKLIIR